jgi:uncharacterized protein YecA (UPF0149 family)
MDFLKRFAKFFSSEAEQVPVTYPGRNELCWCGSGMKYKKCHLTEDEKNTDKKAASCCAKS